MTQLVAPTTSSTSEKLQASSGEQKKQVNQNEPITIDILPEYHDLVALKPEWDALWSRLTSPGYQQSSTYTLVCWQQMHNDKRSALRCIVIRRSGKIVLIWPLLLRRLALIKILSPVWSTGAEYTEPLV